MFYSIIDSDRRPLIGQTTLIQNEPDPYLRAAAAAKIWQVILFLILDDKVFHGRFYENELLTFWHEIFSLQEHNNK